jgi:mono/diheme cytochrome c family protein
MSCYSKIFNKAFTGVLFAVILLFSNKALAADGATLFKENCANCHKPDKDATGPLFKGVRDRMPSPDWVYGWIANSQGTNDPYAKAIKAKWGNSVMTAFGANRFKKDEIDAILDYVDNYKAPVVDPKVGGKTKDDDSYLIYGILTIILAIIAFVLLQVNSNLKKLTDEREGIKRGEPVPFYRNKSYLMVGVIGLFFIGGYFLVQWGVGLGRSKDYQPEQPIYYSHQVHAGTNQIACLYCHTGAQDSKHANIPSVNTCMNCHMAINKYEGKDELVREDGTAVNGTTEIQKLYDYAGWDPKANGGKGAYKADNDGDGQPDGSKPIAWVRIHNLADHVYFNHSQHVKVGKQQCQTCHGNIQEMGEVKQFSDLSMGWCINCHRESKVDFPDTAATSGNKYYSIYEKFHKDMKAGKMDSVTVENIGGTECQKCHY